MSAGRQSQAESRGAPAKRTGSPVGKGSGALMTVAIWAVAAMLVAYTAAAAIRLQSVRAPHAETSLPAQADILAAKLEGEVRTLRAALAASAEMAARLPQSPVDAAEAGLAATGGAAKAVAIAGPEGVRAQTAETDNWNAAVTAAQGSRQDFWIGAPEGRGGALYAALTLNKGEEPLVAAARIDLARLLPTLGADGMAAIASRDGQILAIVGGRGAAQGANLRAVFGVGQPRGAESHIGRTADGAAIEVVQRPVASGALTAVVAAPQSTTAAARAAMERDTLFFLLAPVIIGIALVLLVMIQSRKAKAAHQAQIETEQRFRMAVEAAHCGIWEWDLREDMLVMSDVTGAMLGWGGGGVAGGQEVIARIAPDHRERVRNALDAARTYGAFDVSFRVPRPDGRSIWVDARGQAIAGRQRGEYARIVGVALDVTEERFAQARAQAAETRLRDAIDSVSEAFVLWDRMGRLLMCNTNYRAFFNLEPRVLKPGAPRETVERFAKLAIRQEHPPADGRKGVREAELIDGRWIQISERRTSDGGLVMTGADITAIKTQEETRRLNEEALKKVVDHLEQSQDQLAELARKYEAEKIKAEAANKSKSEFLANMSHELRTPLNAINGFSEIMVGEMFGPLGDARYKEYSQDILNSGQHLLTLINDILDMSKIEAGKMTLRFEPMQFADVVEDTVRLMRNRAENAALTIEVDLPELADIDADYRALKQVLLNLLSNALKFTPRGGRISVRAVLETNALTERLRVSVTDTGIGIAPDDLQRLAQPFEQIESQHSKTQQGTGLGLALTKSLVEMHGGLLSIESEPGVGTTVSFTLPTRQAAPRSTGSFAA